MTAFLFRPYNMQVMVTLTKQPECSSGAQSDLSLVLKKMEMRNGDANRCNSFQFSNDIENRGDVVCEIALENQ